MSRITSIAQKIMPGIVLAAYCVAISGCIYDVPITSKGTRKVDAKLLGDWTSKDGKAKMKVVKLDDSNYVVYNNGDLYRAYHSDVGETQYVSVLNLESSKPQYAYWSWELSGDGTLSLRNVNDEVVPVDTTDSMSVRRLLKENRQNPALLQDAIEMTRDRSE